MSRRLLTLPAVGRAAGFLLVALAIIATAVHFRDGGMKPAPATVLSAPYVDPLAAELTRCQRIGMAAQTDAACEAAWTENRRRFFTYRPADSAAAAAPAPPAAPKSEDR